MIILQFQQNLIICYCFVNELDLKLKQYSEAIEDCDECLALDSPNIKAMLRKCEGLLNLNRKNEAYTMYAHVLEIEPDNIIAKKAIAETSIRSETSTVVAIGIQLLLLVVYFCF